MDESTDLSIVNETDVDIPLSSDEAQETIKAIGTGENIDFALIELVFVDEDRIIEINKEYLNHDYVTDIITFGYNEPEDYGAIEATLFCCAPRIAEQADELEIDHKSEFLRVFIHGLLHLTGYGDRSDEEKNIMRDKESNYINYIAKIYAK